MLVCNIFSNQLAVEDQVSWKNDFLEHPNLYISQIIRRYVQLNIDVDNWISSHREQTFKSDFKPHLGVQFQWAENETF